MYLLVHAEPILHLAKWHLIEREKLRGNTILRLKYFRYFSMLIHMEERPGPAGRLTSKVIEKTREHSTYF